MKTTVSFDQVNIVVPCGDGNLTIAELTRIAVDKFKKLTKPRQHNVIINSIRLRRDNGILDWDDLVCDVLDDREMLIVDYSEQPAHGHHNGDGASAGSSIGTVSPEIMQVINGGCSSVVDAHAANQTDVIVTQDDIVRKSNMSTLIVRPPTETTVSDNRRRTKNLPLSQDTRNSADYQSSFPCQSSDINSFNHQERLPVVPNRSSYTGRPELSRGPGRRSLGNNLDLQKWLDSQQQLENEVYHPQFNRMDPVGASLGSQDDALDESITRLQLHVKLEPKPNQGHGITLRPWVDMKTRENRGIEVRNIDREGTFASDGQLMSGDYITSINDSSLSGLSFNRCVDAFNAALNRKEFVLSILRPAASRQPNAFMANREEPPPLPKRPYRTAPSSPVSAFHPVTPESKQSLLHNETANNQKPEPPPRSPSTKLTTKSQDLNNLNVRKLGRQHTISLTRSASSGFGFTLTSRDNPTGGPNPIYIKKIIHGGPAYNDGRLRVGDRLLKVNDDDVTVPGKSHHSIAELLRSQPVGSKVTLSISRQETADEPTIDTGDFQRMVFAIPLYLYEGGLGINVRWQEANAVSGIYVDSVIPNRAADKDGQLQAMDRLVEINGSSLDGLDRQTATELLKKNIEESLRSTVRLTVERKSESKSSAVPDGHTGMVSGSQRVLSTTAHVIVQPTPVKPLPVETPDYDLNDSRRMKMKELKENRMFASASNLLDHEYCSDEDTNIKLSSFSRESKKRQSMSDKHRAYVDAKSSQFYQTQFLPKKVEKEDMERPYSTLPSTSHMKKMQQLIQNNTGSDDHSVQDSRAPACSVPPAKYYQDLRNGNRTAADHYQNSSSKRPQYLNSPPPAYGSLMNDNGGTPSSPAFPVRPADSVDNLVSSPRGRSSQTQSPLSPDDAQSSSAISTNIKRGGVANTSFRCAVDRSYQSNHHQSSSVPVQATLDTPHHSQETARKKDKNHPHWKDIFRINTKSRKYSLDNHSNPGETSAYQQRGDLEVANYGSYSSSAGRVLEWQQHNEAAFQRERNQQQQLYDSHRSQQANSSRSGAPSVGNVDRFRQTQHLRERLNPVEVPQSGHRDSSSHSVNNSYRRASSVPPLNNAEDPYSMVSENPAPTHDPALYPNRPSGDSSRQPPSSNHSRSSRGPVPLQTINQQQPYVTRHHQPREQFGHAGALKNGQNGPMPQPLYNIPKNSNNTPMPTSMELLPNRRQIRPAPISSSVPHYSVGEDEAIYAFVNKPNNRKQMNPMLS